MHESIRDGWILHIGDGLRGCSRTYKSIVRRAAGNKEAWSGLLRGELR